MNDKDEFFDLPKPAAARRAARPRRGGGFFAGFFWIFVLGCALLGFVLLVVKFTGRGPAVKRAAITWLGGRSSDPAPARPAPPAEAPSQRVVEVEVEKIVKIPVDRVVEKVVEVKPPLPSRYVSWKKVDVAELWSEIPVETEVVTREGASAVSEREREESFKIEMKVSLTIPKPNQSPAELAGINPHLPKMLKEFDELVSTAEVSPFFHHLYQLKTERIQQKVTRIDQILSRHNLYDLETLLEAKSADTGRRLLLAQGEMDTVSDGSDGDRWPTLDDYVSMSQHYQPFTSYGWAKRSDTPNPLLARWETKLKEYEKEFAIPGLGIERNRFLRSQIEAYKPQVADLKSRSYLIAEADPYIVIPLSLLGRRDENEFGPAIGDYVVVVFGDQLYPAIAGDAGPSWKFGEASLRIARQINAKASPYSRPVSDLTVTYLVFPGSAEATKGPPDLEKWHQRCSELLDEIGGLGEGYSLHRWEDLIAKKAAEGKAVGTSAAPATPSSGTPAASTPSTPSTEAPANPGTPPKPVNPANPANPANPVPPSRPTETPAPSVAPSTDRPETPAAPAAPAAAGAPAQRPAPAPRPGADN